MIDERAEDGRGCGRDEQGRHKAIVEALEAKIDEVGLLLGVLQGENESLRRQLGKRKGERECVTREGSASSVAHGRVLTSTGYGFVGSQARPKDLAAAEITGVSPPPVRMYDKIEGGGPVWERQPVVGLRPIGYLESCFLEKNGTPRQANVAPTSRANFSLLFGTNPSHCLQGLGDFSHVWVLWLFHDNGNKRLAPLVHPPRLDGGKKGGGKSRWVHTCAHACSLLPPPTFVRLEELAVAGIYWKHDSRAACAACVLPARLLLVRMLLLLALQESLRRERRTGPTPSASPSASSKVCMALPRSMPGARCQGVVCADHTV